MSSNLDLMECNCFCHLFVVCRVVSMACPFGNLLPILKFLLCTSFFSFFSKNYTSMKATVTLFSRGLSVLKAPTSKKECSFSHNLQTDTPRKGKEDSGKNSSFSELFLEL